jgi:alpha-1,2-mannosyltransferase
MTILGLALLANIENSADRAFATENELIPVDFPVFYMGGKVAWQRGAAPLYYPPNDRRQGYTLLYAFADDATPWAQMARADGFPKIRQFTNPPFSAVLMAPLALMPWQWAFLIWQIITIILTAATIFLALKLLPFPPGLETFALLFAAVCFFYPFSNNLVCGQVNISILFIWTLGVYLLKRQRPMASALCFALGTVLKVSPVVVVPFLALRRQWRWLAAYMVGVVAFTGISVWQLGWQTHLTWLTAIYPSISSGVGNTYNRSLAGLLDALCGPGYAVPPSLHSEWPIPPGLSLVEKACSLAIVLSFLLWCWRKRRDAKCLVDELILLPLVYLLAAPFSWVYHFVFALLPLAYLWAKAREATSAELAALSLGTLALGTELPMDIAVYSPWAGTHLINVAIALWPLATGAIIWVGVRLYIRSQVLDPQPAAAA